MVNNDAGVPSQRSTHLGYRLSHPHDDQLGQVQEELRIYPASSFTLKAKNPFSPSTHPAVGNTKVAEYPQHIMKNIFGEGGANSREDFSRDFASIESTQLLDYRDAQLLFIAARSGDEGLEKSLGDGRGQGMFPYCAHTDEPLMQKIALQKLGQEESSKGIDEVLEELKLDANKSPLNALRGEWI